MQVNVIEFAMVISSEMNSNEGMQDFLHKALNVFTEHTVWLQILHDWLSLTFDSLMSTIKFVFFFYT